MGTYQANRRPAASATRCRRARPGNLKRGRNEVNAEDLASNADNVGGKERDVACSAPSIKDSDPGNETGLPKEALGDRIDELGL